MAKDRETCGRDEDTRDDEFYEDTCFHEAEDGTITTHPTGCHVRHIAPGVEFHVQPAYKRPPSPGALEAEVFDTQIEAANVKARDLRAQRLAVHDEAYEAGMN